MANRTCGTHTHLYVPYFYKKFMPFFMLPIFTRNIWHYLLILLSPVLARTTINTEADAGCYAATINISHIEIQHFTYIVMYLMLTIIVVRTCGGYTKTEEVELRHFVLAIYHVETSRNCESFPIGVMVVVLMAP